MGEFLGRAGRVGGEEGVGEGEGSRRRDDDGGVSLAEVTAVVIVDKEEKEAE